MTIDWRVLGERIDRTIADLIHGDADRPDIGYTAEALRLAIGEHGGYGLTPTAEADRIRELHCAVDRDYRAQAEADLARLHAEMGRVRAQALTEAAEALDQVAGNPNLRLGKYRAEGVVHAAGRVRAMARYEQAVAAAGDQQAAKKEEGL